MGQREDGWLDLGECKWGQVRSLPKLLAELEAKIPYYPLPKGFSCGRWLFLRQKPAGAPALPAKVNTLEDLYGDSAGTKKFMPCTWK